MVTMILEKILVARQHPLVNMISIFLVSATLVTLTVFPFGLETVHFNVKLSDSPELLSTTFGYSDAGSYLKAALELKQIDMLSQNQLWVINLWPPGMVVLDAVILKLFGGSFAFVYALLISFLWTVLGGVFALEVKKYFGTVTAYLSLFFLVLSTPLQGWILGEGLFYAEGISVWAFLFGLVFLIRGTHGVLKTEVVANGVLAGTFLAISAYFRSAFSSLELSLLLLFLIFGAFHQVAKRRSQGTGSTSKTANGTILLFATWGSMFALMEPWLQFTTHFVRGVRVWSVVGANFFRSVWVDRPSSPDFLSAGGIGWGCQIDPNFCAVVSESERSSGMPYPIQDLVLMAVQTIIANPLEYLSDRFHFLVTGWFSNEGAMGAFELATGFISLLVFAYVLVQLIKLAIRGDAASIFILVACALIVAPIMVGHIEPRYFIPLKLLFVILPWLRSRDFFQSNKVTV